MIKLRLMRLCVFVVLILGVKVLDAQVANVMGGNNELIRTKKYEDIRGSAYLYNSWSSGSVEDKDGKIYTNVLLRYDAFKDKFEINQDGQIFEINPLLYPKVQFTLVDNNSGDIQKHEFSSGYKMDGYPPVAYFDIVFSNKVVLLKKVKKEFIEKTVTNYGTSVVQKSFQTNVFYFLLSPSGQQIELKPNKKYIESIPDLKQSFELYSKSTKSKFKSEQDLINFIVFFDGQLTE